MTDSESTERSWRRIGCWSIVVVVGLALITAATLAGVAYLQIQGESREARTAVQAVPTLAGDPSADRPEEPGVAVEGAPGSDEAAPPRGRIELEISVARLIVTPGEAGESIRLDAEYDPRDYELDQGMDELPGGGWNYRLHFRPARSYWMAVLRMKLGDEPPTVRLTLPRDVPLRVTGEADTTFAALELGGLWLDDVDLEVDGGALDVSLLEPLRAPMKSLSLVGDKGSVKVVGLGNASPETALFQQHLGELDLDLRGPWSRDADIRVKAFLAGGSVWLPGDLPVEGLDGRLFRPTAPTSDEIAGPRLRLSVTEHGGRLVFVD
jgi:hypothetical protein